MISKNRPPFSRHRIPPSPQTRAIFVVGSLLALMLVSCGQRTSPPTSSGASTNAAAPAATPAPRLEFQKLVGKWERPDGGYVLEIRSVDASGRMEAGYYNPDPIRVSKALAIQEGAVTKVFVELRDVNYPGCTYSLTYDAQNDQLYGQYFQAAVEQTYDIAFARLK